MIQPVEIRGYSILKVLGEGGMATVYLALQQSLDREVALKVMAPELAANESFCERFIKEGRITAQLTHTHLLTVHDIGVYQGVYYLASEYLPAGTLRERMESGLSVAEALRITCEIAQGLGFAHEKGFVHRDVKPGNILFRANGAAVLADFGIAKAIKSTTTATIAGNAIGTPDYMSPEQAQASPVDGRADLYSLGAVLFEMLTGEKPYSANDPYTVALMHVTEPVPRLPASLSWLQPLIDGMMAKKAEQRFASGGVFIAACKQLLAEHPEGQTLRSPGTRKSSLLHWLKSLAARNWPIARLWSRGRRRPGRIVLVIASLFFVFACVLSLIARWSRVSPPPVTTTNADLPASNLIPLNPSTDVSVSSTNTALGNMSLDELDTPDLLAKAEEYLQFGTTSKENPGRRLTWPPGENAVDLFQKIRDRDPLNARALQGLRRIAQFYTESATKAHDLGFDNQAVDLVEKGLQADPENKVLKQLKAELAKNANK